MVLAASFPFLTIELCQEICNDHDDADWDLWSYLEEVEACVKSEDYEDSVDCIDV